MNKSEFSKLYERVQRSPDAVYRKANVGFAQSNKFPDGSSTNLEVIGIKAPEVLEDELLTLFIWLWSMKDYLKALCATRGIAGSEIEQIEQIEQIANVERPLSIVADIANRAKHGVLSKSRSGDFAKLQHVSISIPQSAVATGHTSARHTSARHWSDRTHQRTHQCQALEWRNDFRPEADIGTAGAVRPRNLGKRLSSPEGDTTTT